MLSTRFSQELIFHKFLHISHTLSNHLNVVSNPLAAIFDFFKIFCTLLKFLIHLENVQALLNKDGVLQPDVATVNAMSGATAQSHSGIYSQNCNPYFLTVLLLGLSSVSINLPTLKSASQYAEAGLSHHSLH